MSNITRYHKPTKYDRYDIGTLCKTLKDMPEEKDIYCFKQKQDDTDKFELHVQVSKDKQNPDWKPIGEFFTKIFNDILYNEEFINEALKLYHNSTTSFLALSKLIKSK